MADINKVKDLLKTVENLSPSGFAIAFHIRLTSPDFLFQTYPKNWIDIYSEKGYVMVDPIVRWGFTEIGAIRWSQLGDLDDQGILEQSLTYGMAYGVAIATETQGSRSVAGFARNDREYSDAEIAALTQHVQDLHEHTASKTGMSEALRTQLHDLSIEMTHPPATAG
ncbi:autoinducer binding domain-containing protein [Octadecabacter sp. G9-8]|uniref:Autoinducer binding domain-containing protein n=1 Tax=Octadecabacter dasysiphoniae TaxID=2909341 RepID=A0ABS9CZ64_9RHOB|nr:autoinducer binding domain-containing protein [Octadecabacter dasysiphoniae]MCF2872201.1 autoinducer binding domain-containing protein [Octadecabacter dasysiphoniae]